MARLFITQREMDFISDITKEVIKDVNAQKIVYYPVSELKTLVHEVYDEAVKKMYDNPIVIEALVDNVTDRGTKIDKFTIDKQFKVEVFIQYRDLIEKGIDVSLGDFFTYGSVLYEISEYNRLGNIFGQVEYTDGVRLVGTRARDAVLPVKVAGPTDISYTDQDAVQKDFYQQRGSSANALGPTGDKRALVEKGVIEEPLTGPKEVSPRGDDKDRNAFYGED